MKDLVNTIDHIKKEKKKTKNKREIRGKAKTFTSIGRCVSDDEESSSSDEIFTILPFKKKLFLKVVIA